MITDTRFGKPVNQETRSSLPVIYNQPACMTMVIKQPVNTRMFIIWDVWAPHGKELPEEVKDLIVRLFKEWQGYE